MAKYGSLSGLTNFQVSISRKLGCGSSKYRRRENKLQPIRDPTSCKKEIFFWARSRGHVPTTPEKQL